MNWKSGKILKPRQEFKPKVCFDLVGCFADPQRPSISLKRRPEDPSVIQTKFLLYTRETREKHEEPEVLYYDDEAKSITKSHFNATRAVKVIVHGFKGSGSDVGGIRGANSLLNLEDLNVIILDWTRGAGTSYQTAVANTELVGRQLALILLDAINLGINPNDIHVVGFSLGAHVAGCASEVLKEKKLLIGRITGLDPASPFFRHHILRQKSRKLDVSDARFVDIIHTDGSEVFTDGFGLLRPIGHVDFFPNGGREQPGCTDVKNSIIYSHFHEDLLDRAIACSHLRAWQLFVESVQSQLSECKFIAWPCTQGANAFLSGTCFPMDNSTDRQEMGYGSKQGSRGIYYLATRAEDLFCGDPLRATVTTSAGAPKTEGSLYLKIENTNATTIFKIAINLHDRNTESTTFRAISTSKFRSIIEDTKIINGLMWYQSVAAEQDVVTTRRPQISTLLIDKLAIEDQKGNRWENCRKNFLIDLKEIPIELKEGFCRLV
ncbi:pancreatic lipase-related protein 2 [Diachasma alloeum]|uniref:pancreatic lipase-related protein 2 n=1 Tax=Diachasma alloeum TaxID=454923 RepID=UPI00073813C1|nr:pancreatic lipase-related protein 2 [Diachasma alloeum]